jgi:hypothetical protein
MGRGLRIAGKLGERYRPAQRAMQRVEERAVRGLVRRGIPGDGSAALSTERV